MGAEPSDSAQDATAEEPCSDHGTLVVCSINKQNPNVTCHTFLTKPPGNLDIPHTCAEFFHDLHIFSSEYTSPAGADYLSPASVLHPQKAQAPLLCKGEGKGCRTWCRDDSGVAFRHIRMIHRTYRCLV